MMDDSGRSVGDSDWILLEVVDDRSIDGLGDRCNTDTLMCM